MDAVQTPIIPTLPELQGCVPNQVIAWFRSERSAGPIRSLHPPLSPVPRTLTNPTAYP